MNGKTVQLSGAYTNNGTLTANAASSILSLIGTSTQTFNIGIYTSNSLSGLTINNDRGKRYRSCERGYVDFNKWYC